MTLTSTMAPEMAYAHMSFSTKSGRSVMPYLARRRRKNAEMDQTAPTGVSVLVLRLSRSIEFADRSKRTVSSGLADVISVHHLATSSGISGSLKKPRARPYTQGH